MLRIVTGPLHPDLEQALVEEIRHLKASDPLAPLSIVVPSDPLRRRLQWLLCIEQDCALLDVHFLTFFQFAVRLLKEAGSFDPTDLRREVFFRELVHHLLRVEAPDSCWSNLTEMPGAWGALLVTLRDLKDAQVNEERAVEALSQNQVSQDQQVRSLFKLYRSFLDEKERIRAYDQDDLAAQAVDHVAQSAFLGRQHRILYYGFYDLTQVQLDLFQAVARAYPVTLFFPLVKRHQAYAFAERFFERYIQGLITRESDVVTLPLGAWPFIKSVIQLLDIRVSGFRRDQVISLLSSTFIRFAALCPSCEGPRPDLWDLASRRLGITKGLEEWRRLTAFLEQDLPL